MMLLRPPPVRERRDDGVKGLIEEAHGRHRRRRLFTGRLLLAVALIGATAYIAIGHGSPGPPSAGGVAGPAHRPAHHAVLTAYEPPLCSSAVQDAPALRSVPTVEVPAGGYPIGVRVTSDGGWAFVTGDANDLPGVRVFAIRSGKPILVRSVAVPSVSFGEALTRDDRYLLVANGPGVAVIDVKRAEDGAPGALLGELDEGELAASDVAVSRDDRFVFVTFVQGAVAVFDLAAAVERGFRSSGLVGNLPLYGGRSLAISPNGGWLYVTSGDSLDTIKVRIAETEPARVRVTSVAAGCFADGVIVSSSGSTVWVTATQSNALLGFSARKLESGAIDAQIARVPVGSDPVGIAIVDSGKRIVVADSDSPEWNELEGSGTAAPPSGSADLSVVSVSAALAVKPALIGTVSAGEYPREVVIAPGSTTALVTNSVSDQLEAVDLDALP